MSRTVTAPAAVTAKAPLALPAEIVNPAAVGVSPVYASCPTAAPLAAVSSTEKAAAVMSIAASVTETENCVDCELVSALVAETVSVQV